MNPDLSLTVRGCTAGSKSGENLPTSIDINADT